MHYLAKRWPLVLVRAIASLAFGFAAFVWAGTTLAVLLLFVAAYAGVDGILSVGTAISTARAHRAALLVRGLLGIGVSAAIVLWPAMSLLTLVYVVAVWAILAGIFEIIAGIEAHSLMKEVWLIVAGALSVLFGIIIGLRPAAGAFGIIWMVGFYAIFYGLSLGALALRLRPFARHPAPVERRPEH